LFFDKNASFSFNDFSFNDQLKLAI
jgi:hypothetical protein